MSSSSTSETEKQEGQYSQVNGQLKQVQGQVYSAIGAVLPSAAGAEGWSTSGEQLLKEGKEKVDMAKGVAAFDSTVDAASAKWMSVEAEIWERADDRAKGYVTGDQAQQTEGNVEAEKAQWKYKQATSDAPLSVPLPSAEGVRGKVESVVGMLSGDVKKQKEGNVRAEKAAWKDGV